MFAKVKKELNDYKESVNFYNEVREELRWQRLVKKC